MTRVVFYRSARVNESLKATHNPMVAVSNPALAMVLDQIDLEPEHL